MAEKKHILSKSTFIKGWQCHKSLYLYKKRYYLRDRLSPEQQARFKRGTNIGILARELFPGGVDASPPSPFQYARSVELTQTLVSNLTNVIYEAAFTHQGVLVALDILAFQDGKWYGYEVKSSLSISETYLMDAALQYKVITGSGLPLSGLFIIFMNKDYILRGNLDLNQLFIRQSVIEEVLELQPFVEQEIIAQLAVVELTKSPAIDIGSHCNYPYPCDFQGHCWKHIPPESIFDLQWLSEEQKFDLYNKGILLPENIPDDYLSDPKQAIKLQAHRKNKIFTDQVAIREYLEKFTFPACFLKVWYHKPALPIFDGTKPYEKLPFFLSLGHLDDFHSEMKITHHFFDPGVSPLFQFKEIIAELALHNRCMITFNDHHPELIYNELVHSDPQEKYTSFLDLGEVLTMNHFYDPAFYGRPDVLAIGQKHLKIKPEEQDFMISEAIAAIEYAALAGHFSETTSFPGKIKKSSAYYLMCLDAFYHHLRILSC